ncbi:MAG: aminopeptidase [Proteobacteria bacterium]|nr:aminopeptidase [Pseudomonadota bacterium]
MASVGLAGTAALAAAAVCLGSGCSTLGYYGQALQGHLELMHRARPVADWLAEPDMSPHLRERLALAQRMRDFASRELALPDNRSYRAYADLQRAAAVWNVVAAPELSLTLKTWCFPVMGCVGYRGYFDRAAAQALGDRLQGEGFEVSVYGVPAYSSLGWSNWIGGDPLLNTFIDWPEGDLARLIFHELAHQVAYAADDTTFNESFATAVERLGGDRWLADRPQARAELARADRRRAEFRVLMQTQRERLLALYAGTLDDAAKRARKAELMSQWRAEYAQFKAQHWGGDASYDGVVARANNASFGVQAAYHELVPAFERLFAREGGDFPRFYAEVRRLAALPKAERRATLDAIVR